MGADAIAIPCDVAVEHEVVSLFDDTEVAEVILWLASDAAGYVTGTLVNCAGGR